MALSPEQASTEKIKQVISINRRITLSNQNAFQDATNKRYAGYLRLAPRETIFGCSLKSHRKVSDIVAEKFTMWVN